MNGPTHRVVAGCAAGLFSAHVEATAGRQSAKPLVDGLLTALFTCLPDVLEPATSPNHRQVFHSVAFAALLSVGLVKVRQWQPSEPDKLMLKELATLAIGGYLIHLALDATTARSLPLI